MPFLLNVEFFLISSDLIESQLLLEIAHCISLSPQSVSSHLISTHLIQCLLSFFHLISSHPISCLLSLSQLFSADHNCSLLFSCPLSFSHLFSSHLSLSQFFSNFHSSSQLFSALRSSCQLILCLLISSMNLLTSSKLFSHLLSWSQLLSARLTSSQLFSAHSQIISALLRPATCSKNESRRQSKRPCAFYREDFAQRSLCTAFTHSKLLHTASLYTQQTFTERSFYTQIAWRSCVCQGIRGGCMKDLPECSWELLAKGVVGRSCKVFNNSLWEDLCRDPGAVLEEVLAWSSTGPCEQILRRSCWKPPQAALGLCIGACMKVFLGCS